MKLSKLLSEDLILTDLDASTKAEAVAILLDLVKRRYPLLDRDRIAAAVEERERIENTSYGHGYAFPHARTDAVERMYTILGISKKGLSDETPDGMPLRIVCLMLTPSSISQIYLQTLSAFACFARNPENTRILLKADLPTEVIDVVYQSAVTVDRDLLVRDIMVEKVITVSPENTLKEVANILYKHRITSMPVVDSAGRVIGVIGNRDLVSAALPNYKTLIDNIAMSPDVEPFEDILRNEDKLTVSSMMQKEFEVTTEDIPVVELAAMMLFKNFRIVPVVRDENMVGVVVMSDLVSKIIRG